MGCHCLHRFFFWDPYNLKVVAFDVVPESLRLSSVLSVLFILFTLFCSSELISTILSSSSLIRSSISDILLLIPSSSGTPLQYSCLENPMDGGAWKAAVHGVTEGQTRLSDFTFTFHFHALEKEMATHFSVLAWRIPGTGEPDGLLSMGSHRVRHV